MPTPLNSDGGREALSQGVPTDFTRYRYWLHGTAHPFNVDEVVVPAHVSGVQLHEAEHDGSYVHLTRHWGQAWNYADWAARRLGAGPHDARIFVVEPLGEVLHNATYDQEYMTLRARVAAELLNGPAQWKADFAAVRLT
jgi:hypothetical protein